MKRHSLSVLFLITILALGLGGCAGLPGWPTSVSSVSSGSANNSPDGEGREAVAVNPTVAPIFRATPTAAPTTAPTPGLVTPVPGESAPSTVITTTVTIFDDTLHPDWSLENSEAVEYTLDIEEPVFAGDRALMLHPQHDFGALYFTLRQDAQERYPRSRVLGLQLWLTGPEDIVEIDDLAISVVGSNEYEYWVADDNSVRSGYIPTFSETRLYFLGLNRAVPPGTWAQIVLWLDERQFDPDYDYVTGFYIKNDAGVDYPILLDEIRLILVAEE